MKQEHSWVDSLIAFITRLPASPWVYYVLVTVFFGAGSIVLRWLDGSTEIGTVNPVTTAFASGTVYCLAVVHYLDGAARRSLAAFRPALGALEPSYGELEHRLTSMPQRTALLAVALGVASQQIGSLASGGGWGISDHTSLATNVFTISHQVILNVFFCVFILRAARQLRVIMRIHRDATGIRLYESAPHNSFSRFTLATAVAVAVPYTIIEIVAALLDETSLFEIVLLVLAVVLSCALFILPLSGMRRRLVKEKSRQLDESDRYFDIAARRLHAQLDSGTLEQTEGLGHAMSALIVEKERLRHVSTSPWSARTFQGFLSSVGLPILLWLITTAASAVIPVG